MIIFLGSPYQVELDNVIDSIKYVIWQSGYECLTNYTSKNYFDILLENIHYFEDIKKDNTILYKNLYYFSKLYYNLNLLDNIVHSEIKHHTIYLLYNSLLETLTSLSVHNFICPGFGIVSLYRDDLDDYVKTDWFYITRKLFRSLSLNFKIIYILFDKFSEENLINIFNENEHYRIIFNNNQENFIKFQEDWYQVFYKLFEHFCSNIKLCVVNNPIDDCSSLNYTLEKIRYELNK